MEDWMEGGKWEGIGGREGGREERTLISTDRKEGRKEGWR